MDGGRARPFAARVRALRRQARLTQEEVADRAGMPLVTYQRTERGGTTPQRDSFEKLAAAFEAELARSPDAAAEFEAAWRAQRYGDGGSTDTPANAAPAANEPAQGERAAVEPEPDGREHPRSNRRATFWALAVIGLIAVSIFVGLIARQRAARPSPAPDAAPADTRLGGLWSEPRADGFTLGGDTARLTAHAFAKSPGDPPVAYVAFTANWPALGDTWRVLCEVRQPRPGSDEYTCPVDLAREAIPPGPIALSFDVYDARGFHHNSPHGIRRGQIVR